MLGEPSILRAFQNAKEQFGGMNVDVEAALQRLKSISLSLHCWQGDDVQGFEPSAHELGGGLAVTGHYPGRARNPNELREDLDQAFSLIPGRHRVNLHAIYGEFEGRRVDRNEIQPHHFHAWMNWAKASKLGLDFNPTFFSHPKASDGFTLAHADPAIRRFWMEHGIACRRIGAAMGRELETPCVTNVWIPDGFKDTPADRRAPRERLVESLDAIFQESLNPNHNLDSVEAKLFGIGSESYVAGSHEFYLGYAITRQKMLCLDTGHFHPTEQIADKLSSVLLHVPRVLLHVSRGVRWDSDHVVLFNDELAGIAQELVRGGWLDRVHLGLDYFDASINRVAAWVIGSRNLLKALLIALLEPREALIECERKGDYTRRLAFMEELKSMPWQAVWNYHCLSHEVPVGMQWLEQVQRYEKNVLMQR